MCEDSEIQERIEMMVTGGRSYHPVKPKMPKQDHAVSLNIHLGFMETEKRMAMSEKAVFVETRRSYSGREINVFEIPREVQDYILWENRNWESVARRAIIKDLYG